MSASIQSYKLSAANHKPDVVFMTLTWANWYVGWNANGWISVNAQTKRTIPTFVEYVTSAILVLFQLRVQATFFTQKGCQHFSCYRYFWCSYIRKKYCIPILWYRAGFSYFILMLIYITPLMYSSCCIKCLCTAHICCLQNKYNCEAK